MKTNQLAERANLLHDEIETHLRSAVIKAKECGEVLNEAKKQTPHGTWMDWLEENFKASHQTACAYMRIAKHWDCLESIYKAPEEFEGFNTIDAALKLIARYKPSKISNEDMPIIKPANKLKEIEHLRKDLIKRLGDFLPDLLDVDELSEIHHKRLLLDGTKTTLPDGRLAIVISTRKIGDCDEQDPFRMDVDALVGAIADQNPVSTGRRTRTVKSERNVFTHPSSLPAHSPKQRTHGRSPGVVLSVPGLAPPALERRPASVVSPS
ncbi:DUF3102 domain-containing protein [Roseimaritima ulvae]|uniref:DUF3102 domain-containing protein n=1 Tax=Roseimaritima ulvae TaxID=980254 RepID=A0A5B9QJZ7_9BACT|nr:DUF3102 domain-containing protein [Roseimaritima ulvae]QEG39388.1 hypothetical protein UC8_13650 [Roseimaritima ulvae]